MVWRKCCGGLGPCPGALAEGVSSSACTGTSRCRLAARVRCTGHLEVARIVKIVFCQFSMLWAARQLSALSGLELSIFAHCMSRGSLVTFLLFLRPRDLGPIYSCCQPGARCKSAHRDRSRRQLKLFVVPPCQEIVIEEVYIQRRLQAATHPHNPLPVGWLCQVAVDPIQDIEPPVRPAYQMHTFKTNEVGHAANLLRKPLANMRAHSATSAGVCACTLP